MISPLLRITSSEITTPFKALRPKNCSSGWGQATEESWPGAGG